MVSVKFEDMTKDQQEVAFAKFMKTKEARTESGKTKRTALTKLKNLHLEEYNALVKAESS